MVQTVTSMLYHTVRISTMQTTSGRNGHNHH